MNETTKLDFPSHQQNSSMGEGQLIYPKLYKGGRASSINLTEQF